MDCGKQRSLKLFLSDGINYEIDIVKNSNIISTTHVNLEPAAVETTAGVNENVREEAPPVLADSLMYDRIRNYFVHRQLKLLLSPLIAWHTLSKCADLEKWLVWWIMIRDV